MSDFEIVSKNKKVDPCYGLETLHITKEEIEALLSGKKLYSTVNDGEYAITIAMKKKEPIDSNNWIKCSDHLPDLDVEVLGTEKEYGNVVKVARMATCLEDCGWEWVLADDIEGTSYKPDEIIAWMPLPEGFKEEE